jgi:hypothetical protein
MKRYLTSALVILTLAVIAVVVYLCQSTARITVANNGTNVIEIRTDSSEMKTLLGENGTGYFDGDSKIHIGDALISVDRRLEVINTGSGVIQVAYQDVSGSEKITTLGEGGSGYFAKATPINIGEINIRVGSVQ